MSCADVQTIQAGNGVKTQFSFDFPYISKSEIQVSFWNATTKEWDVIAQTDANYPWQVPAANPTIVEFTSTAPPAPAVPVDPNETAVDNVRISRVTNIDSIRALFNPGSAIRSDDLNKNFEQLRYAIQEANCQGISDELYQYLLDNYWDRFDNTIYSGDTWVSNDTKLATTGAIDNRIDTALTNVDIPGTLNVTGLTTLDSTLSMPLGSAGTPSILFTNDPDTGIYSPPGGDQIAISTAGVGRLFVDATGSVGIGESNPSSYSPLANNLVIRDSRAGISLISGSSLNSNIFFGDTADADRGYISYLHNTDSLEIGVNAATQLVIDSAGDVRIIGGATSNSPAVLIDGNAPALSLRVLQTGNVTTAGTMTADSFIPTSSTVPTNGVYLPSANNVAISTSGTGRLFVDSSGRVGVGTTSPAALLEIARLGSAWTGAAPAVGTAIFINNGNNFTTSPAYLQISAGNTTDAGIYFGDSDSNGPGRILYGNYNNSLRFHTNEIERACITSDGNLGLGISLPQAKLHLNNAAGLSRIRLSGGASLADNFEFGQGTTGATNGGFEIRDVDANATRFVIDKSGNVGLGVSTPGDYLYSDLVIDGETGGMSIVTGTTGTGRLAFADGITGAGGAIQYDHLFDRLELVADGNPRVYLNSTGLGLGIELPKDLLHVMESSASAYVPTGASVAQFERAENVGITLSTASAGDATIFFGDTASSTVGRVQYDHSNDSLGFWTNSAERVVITADGLLEIKDDRLKISTPKTPTSASDTGTTGEICWDADYIYVCTATNTWKRAALSTW